MPIETRWYDDTQKIIYVELSGVVVTEDLYTGNTDVARHAKQVDYPVYVLFDTLNVQRFSANFVQAVRHLDRHMPDNVALLILVRNSGNMLLEVMDRIIKALVANLMRKQRVAFSIEEAFQMIETHQAEISTTS